MSVLFNNKKYNHCPFCRELIMITEINTIIDPQKQSENKKISSNYDEIRNR